MADSNKTPYKILLVNGRHLFSTGYKFEAILSENHCFLFDEKELVFIFAHQDYPDEKLIPYCCHVFHVVLPAQQPKH